MQCAAWVGLTVWLDMPKSGQILGLVGRIEVAGARILNTDTSSTFFAVASVAANPFTILVANGLCGLKANSLALVALSYAVFATFTACNTAIAPVFWLFKADAK